MILQATFTSLPPAPQSGLLDSQLFFGLLIAGIVALIIVAILFLLRSILRSRHRQTVAFDRLVLEILVPKERKSEGEAGQNKDKDRLEQIREEIGITETFFAAVAGIKAQRGLLNWLQGRSDHVSCEMVVHDGMISFYVETPKRFRQMIEQQVHAQYPHAEINQITDYNIFTEQSSIVGAYLVGAAHAFFPLKTYKSMDSDPLSGVLNVLAKIREHNSAAAIQFVIRSAHKRWRRKAIRVVREVKKGKPFEQVVAKGVTGKTLNVGREVFSATLSPTKKDGGTPEKKKAYELSAMEEEMLKGIEEKLAKGGLDITARLLSVADSAEVAKMNLDNLIHGFSQYNLYRFGNSFKAVVPRNQTQLIRDFMYRSFNPRRDLIVNTEEMAGLWHLPLHSTEAPNIRWLGARKAPPPSNVPQTGLRMGHVQYRGIDVPIHIKEEDRRRHMYIIGKSGSGKSVFITNMAIQDIAHGKGVCVVDPHGDLVQDILEHIPKHRADDVIVFNPSDIERPIGLNILEAKTEDQKDFAVQEMISIFYKLFPPEMIGPMFEHQMRNVMLTLMADIEHPGTIIDIPRMFTDDAYVKLYLQKLKDPVVRAFWEKEMAKTSDFHKSEMLGYLISKVGRFVENGMMRNIMGQQKSGFDFRDIMDEQKILLVNLAKGTTGEVNAKLIGLIVVAKLQMAAMSRASLDEEHRKDFYLYIDEFQNFVTDSIATILSEARKYRLNLTIAHQYMGQLVDDKGKTEIRDAVLGNVGTMNAFRIGPEDAEVLAKEFAPTFGSYDLLNVPKFSCYTKLLIDNTASKPFNMLTDPPRKGSADIAEAIAELSRLKFGRDRHIVEAEIMERTQLDRAEGRAQTDMTEASL